MTIGELEVGGDHGTHPVLSAGVVAERGSGAGQRCGELVEPDERHGGDDLGPAVREVAIQHGLAVLDGICEPPYGHRLPSALLGEGSGCGDDPLLALGELASFACVCDSEHQLNLALLEFSWYAS